jgi:hypothetical protein
MYFAKNRKKINVAANKFDANFALSDLINL